MITSTFETFFAKEMFSLFWIREILLAEGFWHLKQMNYFKLFCPFSLSDDMLEWNPFDSEPTEDSFGVQFDKLRKTHGSNDSKCWVQTCKYIFPCQDKLVTVW